MHKTVLVPTLLLLLTACGGGTGSVTPGPQPGPSPQPTPSPVGTPAGTPVTATIGASGGTLSLPDGSVRIDIPAGALSGDQTVGIEPITDTAPGHTGQGYRLTPEGTTFAKPVRLTFTYTDADVDGSAPQALSIATQDGAGVWQMYRKPNRDLAAHTVSVDTTHFSDWSMVQGVQLLPLKATVHVGQSIALRVVHCAEPPSEPDDLFVPLTNDPKNECGSAIAAVTAKHWAVNSISGGSSSVGTIQATGTPGSGTAMYAAPAQKPGQNPVAVSVDVDDAQDGPLTLVANVKVIDDLAQWQGTVTYTETGSRPWTVQSGFVGSGMETFKQVHTFKVLGVKEASGPSTTLLLEETGLAEYTDNGSVEKKVYEQCQAFGPVVLRYDTIYQKAMRLSGATKRQFEARLYIADGGYNLYLSGDADEMKGQEAVTSLEKNGCDNTVSDRSYTRDWDTPRRPQDIQVVGQLTPGQGSALSGGYNATGEGLTVPTKIRVDWNLSVGN